MHRRLTKRRLTNTGSFHQKSQCLTINTNQPTGREKRHHHSRIQQRVFLLSTCSPTMDFLFHHQKRGAWEAILGTKKEGRGNGRSNQTKRNYVIIPAAFVRNGRGFSRIVLFSKSDRGGMEGKGMGSAWSCIEVLDAYGLTGGERVAKLQPCRERQGEGKETRRVCNS